MMARAGLSGITWLVVGFETVALILAVGLGWLLGSPPSQMIEVTWGAIGLGLVATVPAVLLMAWSLWTRWGQRLLETVADRLRAMFGDCSTIDIAIVSIAAGVGEEALFRGAMQGGLSSRIGPLAALVVVSTLFGLVHWVTPLYALLAGLMGAYLGWITLASDNLLVAMIVHAVYDFVAVLYLTHRLRAGSSPATGPEDRA